MYRLNWTFHNNMIETLWLANVKKHIIKENKIYLNALKHKKKDDDIKIDWTPLPPEIYYKINLSNYLVNTKCVQIDVNKPIAEIIKLMQIEGEKFILENELNGD